MTDSYDDIISAHSEILRMIDESKNSSFSALTSNCSFLQEEASEIENSNNLADDVEAFIDTVNEFINIKEQLIQLKENIFSSRVEEYSSDILDCEQNDKRSLSCLEVTSQLQKIVTHKNLLAWYIQQPVVSNFLQMNHSYIKDLKELFGKLVDILINFDSYYQSLNQTQLPDFEKSEKCIYMLTELIESTRMNLKNVNNLNVLVDQ